MESYQVPPAAPPPRRRSPLTWVVVGLGALLLLQLIAGAVLLAVVPEVRGRVTALFARPSGPPPPERPGLAGGVAEPERPLRIEDNFDGPTPRWDQSLSRMVDGALEMRIDIPNYDGYTLFLGPEPPEPAAEPTPPAGDPPAEPAPAPPVEEPLFDSSAIDDFDIAVDVQQVAGDPTAEYGIRFRQSGPGDYLLFSISGTGYYRLLRVRAEQYEPIIPWTFDGRIRTGEGAVNRLRVVAQGASVTGAINGAQVVTYQDEIDVGGQLTLGLQTYDAGGVAVRFDNIAGAVGDVNLAEDFENPSAARWSTGGSQLNEGQYEIIAGPNIQTWQQPLPTGSSRVGGFTMEVDASIVSGEGTGVAYGVMFGDGGSFDYYSLLIFPEGGLALLRSNPTGAPDVLVPPIPVEVVNPGLNQPNTIRITVEGRNLTVELNGTELGTLELDEEPQGMIGLIVSSGNSDGVRVRFDNFRLEETAP